MASAARRLQRLSQALQVSTDDSSGSGSASAASASSVCRPSVAAGDVAIDGRPPVCLVIGGGRGIGGNVARRFARDGFTACVVLRSNADSMEEVCSWIRDDGGTAHGYLADATSEAELGSLVAEIERDVGPIHVAVYNLNAFIARTLDQTTTEIFDTASQLGARGAFLLAQAVTPYMLARPASAMQSIFFTSAASALRANATQSAHAAGLSGRRAIAQALSHELWPLGIHVATINVDGPVNSEDTSGRRSEDWENVRYAYRKKYIPLAGCAYSSFVMFSGFRMRIYSWQTESIARVCLLFRAAAQASGTMLEPDAVADGFAYVYIDLFRLQNRSYCIYVSHHAYCPLNGKRSQAS
jgi:NAD(P)-dependent dehydrogenase (short-subunit alcohol dehydrogenase family)